MFPDEENGDDVDHGFSSDRHTADKVIITIFNQLHEEGKESLPFDLGMVSEIQQRYVDDGKNTNTADIPYRYKVGRNPIPDEIKRHGNWIVKSRQGRGKYEFFLLKRDQYIEIPDVDDFEATEVLESTPDVVLKYSSDDEQSMLSRLKYSRLLGTFLQLTVHHIQSHVRTSVESIGQVEIDDLYVGVDKEGNEFIIPVEAKGKKDSDRLAVQQLHAMNEFASECFPDALSRPVGVKEMNDGSVMIVELNTETDINEIKMKDVKRYRLTRLEF